MVTGKATRLNKIARDLNVGISTIVEFLSKKGVTIDSSPNTKIELNVVSLLEKEFSKDSDLKRASEKVNLRPGKKESVVINDGLHDIKSEPVKPKAQPKAQPKVQPKAKVEAEPKAEAKVEQKPESVVKEDKVELKVIDKIDLDSIPKGRRGVVKSTPVKEKKEAKETASSSVEPKPALKGESKPAPKSESKPAPKSESKPAPKSESKPAPKGESKPAPKGESKPAPKGESKPAPKGESKPAPKSESSAKNIVKTPAVESQAKPILVDKKVADVKIIAVEKSQEVVASSGDDKSDSESAEGVFKLEREKLSGPKVMGKITLPVERKPEKKSRNNNANSDSKRKRKRKRIGNEKVDVNSPEVQKEASKKGRKPSDGKATGGNNGAKGGNNNGPGGANKGWNKPGGNRPAGAGAGAGARGKKRPNARRPIEKVEVSEEDVQKKVRDTLAQLTSKGKSKGVKHRRDKRAAVVEKQAQEAAALEQEKKVIKVTEFVSVSELASMMDVPVNNIIATCMNLGLFVSINQRLDAETITLVADEFGFEVEFISVEVQEAILDDVEELEEDIKPRAPIVTVMGHVDHGKTSLLDYVRKANVIAGEAGGITQHIGAYNVSLDNGKRITFLDTPGHEAFTAMRARGAQVTDIVIIIVAADDNVMPQTVEAINHATAAGVPIIFAINKIDRDASDPEKIKGELANMNYMVEDWGGKYQSQEISAKTGLGVDELMEKVLLEAEMLDLKANPKKKGIGSVIESSLDKGRGYLSTVLVQGGTLRQGDVILAGQYFGHVKAMFNERNQRVQEVGPSEPVLILGLNGAPQAGDIFNMMGSEKDARQIANKREQLQREQGLRTQKHITLDEIGRRIAIGNFQELNVIIKGDVDGSIEALSGALIKLSTEEIAVNVIHKAVGQISESDVMLATASNAIIIGFQVRPSVGARKLAENEEIDIRLYSIIYDAIEELKSAMEGMLSPEIKEEITSTVEVREVFTITKVGTIAGCFVREGKINRNSKIRLIRDGIVVYSGGLGSLKRFKDDVKEVTHGYECGLNITNYNDIKVDDVIEAYEEVEIAKKL